MINIFAKSKEIIKSEEMIEGEEMINGEEMIKNCFTMLHSLNNEGMQKQVLQSATELIVGL